MSRIRMNPLPASAFPKVPKEGMSTAEYIRRYFRMRTTRFHPVTYVVNGREVVA